MQDPKLKERLAKEKLRLMKLCRKALLEISVTPPDQGFRFLALKKKAAKYLERAKAVAAEEAKLA